MAVVWVAALIGLPAMLGFTAALCCEVLSNSARHASERGRGCRLLLIMFWWDSDLMGKLLFLLTWMFLALRVLSFAFVGTSSMVGMSSKSISRFCFSQERA